jgi:hypothetical protein
MVNGEWGMVNARAILPLKLTHLLRHCEKTCVTKFKFELKRTKHVFVAIYPPFFAMLFVQEGDCFVPRNDVHAGFSTTKLIVFTFSNNKPTFYVIAGKHARQELDLH